MRVAALILAILGGLSGLSFAAYANVALLVFGVAGLPPHQVGLAKLLIFGLPIASFIGGGLALSKPGPSGAILITSALGYLPIAGWLETSFFTMGTMLLIGAAGFAALLSLVSTETAVGPGFVPSEVIVNSAPSHAIAVPPFDRTKWNALVKYDPQIGQIAEKLRTLGDKWVEIFAADYLALGDKQYLPEIVRKIIADAKTEAETNERIGLENKERQRQEDAERAKRQALESATRERRVTALKYFFWGTALRKSAFLTLALVSTVSAAFLGWNYYKGPHSKEAVRAAFQKRLSLSTAAILDHTKLNSTMIVGDYALQGWSGDVMGGEALLKYDAVEGRWVVMLSSGGALSVDELVKQSVPKDVSEALLANRH